MKRIYSSPKDNQYANKNMEGKYVYMKRSNKEMDIHYIFNIKNVISVDPVEYEVERQYYFCIPFDKDRKCFYYDSKQNVKLDYNDVLYELSYDEWIDTFRSFITNENKSVNEIPSKIIKDRDTN